MVIINRNNRNSDTVTQFTPLDESTRDNILDEILLADSKLPENYTSSDVAKDTKRIALKYDVRVMQVAAVRANLAMGRYDEMFDYS